MLNTKNMFKLIMAGLTFAFFTQSAMANEPVAMITEIEGKVELQGSTQESLDFGADLYVGNIIKLEKNARISITYYNSCRQEWVDGSGVVEIGLLNSLARQGKIGKTETYECEIPNVQLSQADSHIKVGYVIRGIRK